MFWVVFRWLLCVFLLAGCDLALDAGPSTKPTQQETSGLDFAPGQLAKHFHKHGVEVGAKSQAAYLAMARAVVSRSGVATAKRSGDTLYYDRRTNEFAVVSAKGVLRTYFKPSNGERYWEKQKQLSGAKKAAPSDDEGDGDE